MNRTTSLFRAATAAGWIAAAAGCAAWDLPSLKLPQPPVADVRPIRKERAENAIKAFEEQRNRAQYEAAATFWRQGDIAAARNSLASVLEREKNHRESLLLLAEIELEHGRTPDAVGLLRRAAESHPQNAEVAYKLGLALEADHKISEALHYFRIAGALAPDEVKYSEAYSLAENALHSEGKAAPAAQIADGAPHAAATHGSANEHTMPAETAAAVRYAPAAGSSVAVENRDAEFEKVLAHWDAGQKPEAKAALAKLLARNPKHIEGAILQTEIDLEAERFAEARERMERLVIRHPQNAQVRRACGLVYRALGDEQRAAHCLAQAERLERAQVSGTESIETAKQETEIVEIGQAVSDLPIADDSTSPLPVAPGGAAEQLLLTLPEAPSPRSLDARLASAALPIRESIEKSAEELTADEHRRRALEALQAAEPDVARVEFTAAMTRRPKDSQLVIDAAVQSLKYEQPELALELAERGRKNFPRSAALARLEGTAAYQLGRYPEAERALRQSLSLDNSQGLTYFLLGSVLNRLGDSEAAERHFRDAARLDRRFATKK